MDNQICLHILDSNPQIKNVFLALKVKSPCKVVITQRSLQSVLIFRLLLKITVERLRECVSSYFLSPQGAHEYIILTPIRDVEIRKATFSVSICVFPTFCCNMPIGKKAGISLI